MANIPEDWVFISENVLPEVDFIADWKLYFSPLPLPKKKTLILRHLRLICVHRRNDTPKKCTQNGLLFSRTAVLTHYKKWGGNMVARDVPLLGDCSSGNTSRCALPIYQYLSDRHFLLINGKDESHPRYPNGAENFRCNHKEIRRQLLLWKGCCGRLVGGLARIYLVWCLVYLVPLFTAA